MTPLETLLAATNAGARLRVDRVRDKLIVEWADERPADEILAALKQHRDWLMVHLVASPTSEWDAVRADELMCATLARISVWHDELAPWCVVDDAGWHRRETLVNAAYHARNMTALESALERYERFALETFRSATPDGTIGERRGALRAATPKGGA
jgi:hypothetical protein